jgi:holo-[acyl-carrier protein] synthase
MVNCVAEGKAPGSHTVVSTLGADFSLLGVSTAAPSPSAPVATVGVDLVDVQRVARAWTRPGAPTHLLTAAERAYCRARPRTNEHVAARFAAKEAVLKALGTGLAAGMRWTDVEIVNDRAGRPRVRLHGEAARRAERRGVLGIEVSLSHTAGLALAHAVAFWTSDQGEATA